MATPPENQSRSTDDVRNQLDATVGVLEGGVAALSPAAARATIERWLDTLAAHDGLNDVASALGELRSALAATPIDAATVGPILSRLGERTTAAAEQADDEEVAERVRTLGGLLSHAGHAMQSRGGPSRTDEETGTAAPKGAVQTSTRGTGPMPQGPNRGAHTVEGDVGPARPSESPGRKFDP